MENTSKTIIDSNGKILLYSVNDFYEKIVKGTNCFICGADVTPPEKSDYLKV